VETCPGAYNAATKYVHINSTVSPWFLRIAVNTIYLHLLTISNFNLQVLLLLLLLRLLLLIIQFFILTYCTNSQVANYRYSTKKIVQIIKKKCL
jgi:hypothetical protein